MNVLKDKISMFVPVELFQNTQTRFPLIVWENVTVVGCFFPRNCDPYAETSSLNIKDPGISFTKCMLLLRVFN